MTRRRAAVLGAIALAAIGLAIFALTRPEKVTVPTVLGDSLSAARAKLENRGFDVETREVPSCNTPNTVTEQDPPSGSEADEGSTVMLTVSRGLSVRVPDVRGDEFAKAKSAVEREQLGVEDRQRPSRNVKAGDVIDTEPPPGTTVDCQSTVTLVVSEGASLVTLPNLLGQQQESAEAELRRLDLIPNVETRNADQPEGEVIGQDPGPGSRLEKGTEVTIVVSTGAGSVIVPNVVGQSEDAARQTLQGRGLSVEIVRQETDVRSEDGRVLEQAPSAGERVRQGEFVTIVVGQFVEPPPEPEPPTTTTPTTPEASP